MKVFNKKNIIIFFIFLIFGCISISLRDNRITKINDKLQDIKNEETVFYGKIVSIPKQESNKTSLVVKTNYFNNSFKLNIITDSNLKLNLGDNIAIFGTYKTITSYKNKGTFNLKEYSNRNNNFGNVFASKIKIIKKNKNIMNIVKEHFFSKIENSFEEEKARSFRSNYFRK